ncbi:hypothetical protein MMC06_003470 [Schaereria dolodes]|nr:hypothetical protein [Schaereria dolodes]
MRSLFSSVLIASSYFSISALCSDSSSTDKITSKLYYQPFLSPTPLPLAELSYALDALSIYSASIASFTPPSVPSSLSPSSTTVSESQLQPESLVRIGILGPSGTNLSTSTLVGLGVFHEDVRGRFRVVIRDGKVGSVGYYAHSRRTPSEPQQVLPEVEVVKPSPAPRPILNRPVALSSDGKVEEKEVEKSFIQK